MSLRLAALLLVALSSGCLEQEPTIDDPWPRVRPADWDSGVELVPYNGFRAHSAYQTLDAAPPDDRIVERPAGCAAYQDGKRSALDECEVSGPDTSYGRTTGPWTLHASWNGRGEDLIEQERDESRRTVVAYRADGSVLGHVPRAEAFAIE